MNASNSGFLSLSQPRRPQSRTFPAYTNRLIKIVLRADEQNLVFISLKVRELVIVSGLYFVPETGTVQSNINPGRAVKAETAILGDRPGVLPDKLADTRVVIVAGALSFFRP